MQSKGKKRQTNKPKEKHLEQQRGAENLPQKIRMAEARRQTTGSVANQLEQPREDTISSDVKTSELRTGKCWSTGWVDRIQVCCHLQFSKIFPFRYQSKVFLLAPSIPRATYPTLSWPKPSQSLKGVLINLSSRIQIVPARSARTLHHFWNSHPESPKQPGSTKKNIKT